MLKILHILDKSVPNLSGYSIRAKYIVRFQKEYGLNPVCITSPKYEVEPQNETINGISYYRSYIDTPTFFLKIPFLKERIVMDTFKKNIRKVVEKEKIDIIHAHSPSLCGLPAMAVAKDKNIPFVYEIRAFWEDAAVDLARFKENSFKYKVSQYMEGKLFKDADALIAICEGIKTEIFRRVPRENIYIVKNGIDVEQFKPREKGKKIIKKYNLENKVIVGFIGTFFKFEGLELLLKAVPGIIRGNKNVVFMIVGAGVEDSNLRNFSRSNPVINENVIFTGRMPHEEILDFYSVMDILVYPRISKRITEFVTPLKPLEAMSMEKAVLISDVGGLKELIDNDRTGIYFRAGDTDDLAGKILMLAGNPQLREQLGKTARAEVVQHRNWSKIVPKYLEIYEALLSKSK